MPKKKEAGHQKMPIAHTYSVASKKKNLSSHHDCPTRPTPQVGSVQRQKKKNEWGNASITMLPTDGFHAAAEIKPFRHQLQAILAGLAGDIQTASDVSHFGNPWPFCHGPWLFLHCG